MPSAAPWAGIIPELAGKRMSIPGWIYVHTGYYFQFSPPSVDLATESIFDVLLVAFVCAIAAYTVLPATANSVLIPPGEVPVPDGNVKGVTGVDHVAAVTVAGLVV